MWYEEAYSAPGSEELVYCTSPLAEYIQALDDSLLELLKWSSTNFNASDTFDDADFNLVSPRGSKKEQEISQKARRIATNVAPLSKVSRKYFEKVKASLVTLKDGLENQDKNTIHEAVIAIREHVLEAKDLLHFKLERVKYKLQRAQQKLEEEMEPDQNNSKTMARVRSFEVEAPHLVREMKARDKETMRKIEQVIKKKSSRLWKYALATGAGVLTVGSIIFVYVKGIPFLYSLFTAMRAGTKQSFSWTKAVFRSGGSVLNLVTGTLAASAFILVIFLGRGFTLKGQAGVRVKAEDSGDKEAISATLLSLKEDELNPVDVFYENTINALGEILSASDVLCAVCEEDIDKAIVFVSWEAPFLESNTEVCLRHCNSLISSYKSFCKSVKYKKRQSKLAKKYSGNDMRELEMSVLGRESLGAYGQEPRATNNFGEDYMPSMVYGMSPTLKRRNNNGMTRVQDDLDDIMNAADYDQVFGDQSFVDLVDEEGDKKRLDDEMYLEEDAQW